MQLYMNVIRKCFTIPTAPDPMSLAFPCRDLGQLEVSLHFPIGDCSRKLIPLVLLCDEALSV